MKDLSYIIAFATVILGVFADNIVTVGLSIFTILQLIYFELKKLNDK